MKKILLGAVIGGLLTTFLLIKFQPGPTPGPVKVSEKPTGKADLVLIEKKEGEVQSRVPVTPVSSPQGKTPKNVLTLAVGSQYTAPANGEVKTIYLDQAGRRVGGGVHPITGETKVTVGPEWLDIQTKLQESVTVAVDLPERSWLDLYGGVQTDLKNIDPIMGLEYGRSLKNKNFYFTISGNYDPTNNWSGEYKALYRYRFNLK